MPQNGRAPNGQRVALVRPPRTAMGGGAALPFGSGAPGLPAPGSRRERLLAKQWRDDARGRWTERNFVFPDANDGAGVAPGAQTNPGSSIEVTSNHTSFVRLVAIKGTPYVAGASVGYTTPANFSLNQAAVFMRLRLQINGEEDLITDGTGSTFASYADLFLPTAPWFWFAAPPRLRVGDKLLANWENTDPNGDDGDLGATLVARLVDDAWWETLYGT